jgi:hypothetical protein
VIHLAVTVLKDTQMSDLLRQVAGVLFCIILGNTQQDQQTLPYIADPYPIHGN